MDFYHYYLRRMTKANDKKIAAASCRDMALRLFDTGPLAWSIESGACLLSALHELDTDGVDVLPIFDEIEQASYKHYIIRQESSCVERLGQASTFDLMCQPDDTTSLRLTVNLIQRCHRDFAR